jgi:hypothetical protein
MSELIKLNRVQQISVIQSAKKKVDIWGRGTGKSFLVGWDVNMINRTMPRAITAVTGQTYGQLLTRTLPSTFKFLASLGYVQHKDKANPGNYVIGIRPPAHFLQPFEKVMRYENVISFSNGNALLLLSQDRSGSARGPNVDYEILDEALTIDKEQYDQETSPTNRGNEEIWGTRSRQPVPWHHGFHYVSSMPFLTSQKWLLSYADYYEKEAKIQLFSVWNRIVKMQLQLIEAKKAENVKLFTEIWNETIRLRKQILPFVAKDGLLFTMANAFDNIDNVGFSYLMREFDKQTLLTFLIEIMNMILDKVEDCYYHIDDQRHIYYNASNDSFIRDYAENNSWDMEKLSAPDGRFDLDCNPAAPLEVVPDWGAKICLFSVAQERDFDFASKVARAVDCVINEFYVKPDASSNVMINELVDEFSIYYRFQTCREIRYFRDRYGDSRQPNAKNAKSYNEQAIDRLKKNGWQVTAVVHKGMEPPQHDKKLLWDNILKGVDPRFPQVRFNGSKCKYTLISMNNTRVIDKDGKFAKDKSSERSSSILPEEATHFGDAVDKRIWTKYGERLTKISTFVAPRI